MWIYVPETYCQSVLESEDSISASTWRAKMLEQFAMWREKPSLSRHWLKRWKQGGWIKRLFGRIYEPSTARLGVESWIRSLAESRASLIPSPDFSAERTTSETSGPTPQESLPISSPVESFLRTSLASLHLTELECAYTAGLIDGEGWIGIQQSKNYYGIAVDVGMAEKAKPLLDEMATKFGGKVTKFRNQTDKWATAYRWRTFGATAATLLLAIRPYLSLKPQQADIALELQLQLAIPPHNTKWTPELRKQAANWKNQIHQLNQRGPHVPTVEDAWTALREDNHISTNELGQTYEEWVTQLRRDYSRRLRSAQAINGSDSSSWPTPRTQEHYQGGEALEAYVDAGYRQPKTRGGKTRQGTFDTTLTTAAMATGMWPTPRVSSANGPSEAEIEEGNPKRQLETETAMWPTPTSSVAGEALNDEMDIYTLSSGNLRKRAKSGQTGSIGLSRVAALQSPSSLHSETTPPDGHVCSPKCRKLNPLFVELHMGVPMFFSSMKTESIDSDRWETWLSLSRERLHLLISHTKPDCMMGVSDED